MLGAVRFVGLLVGKKQHQVSARLKHAEPLLKDAVGILEIFKTMGTKDEVKGSVLEPVEVRRIPNKMRRPLPDVGAIKVVLRPVNADRPARNRVPAGTDVDPVALAVLSQSSPACCGFAHWVIVWQPLQPMCPGSIRVT